MNILRQQSHEPLFRVLQATYIAASLLGLAAGSSTSMGISVRSEGSWVPMPSSSGEELPQDTDGDGLIDSWEIQFFGNLRDQCGSDDPDGDGVNNAGEMAAGTSPTNRWD